MHQYIFSFENFSIKNNKLCIHILNFDITKKNENRYNFLSMLFSIYKINLNIYILIDEEFKRRLEYILLEKFLQNQNNIEVDLIQVYKQHNILCLKTI